MTTKIFETYVFETREIDSARTMAESILNVIFSKHQSDYLGSYFRWGEPYGQEIILQKNEDDEGHPIEPELHADQILLQINLPSNPDLITSKMQQVTGVSLFKRRTIEPA